MTGIGSGFFLTHRSLFKHEIWKNPIDFRLFFLIFGNAVFTDIEHKGMIIKRGQWLRSYRQLQKDLEYIENQNLKQPSLSVIKYSIDRLTKNSMIENLRTHLGTLFTVVNYEKYQGLQDFKSDTLELTLEHQNPEPLNKNNKNNTNNKNINNNKRMTDTGEKRKKVNIYDEFYLSYGKQPSPLQIDQLFQFSENDGLDQELLVYAIKKASNRSTHFAYLTTILKKLSEKGIKTIDQAEELEGKRQSEWKEKKGMTPRHEKSITIDHKEYDFGF